MAEHGGQDLLDVFLPRSVGELLDFVEELPSDAAGELVFGDTSAQRGVVFVESNRICWAAARGLSRRLVDLLRARADLAASPSSLEQIFVTCKAERRPFGEALLSSGLVKQTDLREALRIHTAESIVSMMQTDASSSWNARTRGGYSPRFTFATGEILAQVAAGMNPTHAQRTLGRLGAVTEGSDWGAAFVRSRHAAEPVPVASVGNVEVSGRLLLGIGKWAVGELDVARVLSPGSPLVANLTAERMCAMAWSEDDVVYVVQTTELGLGRVLRRRSL